MPQGWQSVKVQAFAIVDGVQLDVVECVTSYEINNIPRCTVTVPVGREITTLLASNIHQISEELTQQRPFELWIRVGTGGQEFGGDFWPPGDHRIFLGYVSGTGFRRGDGHAQYVIHAKHWLIDLDYSSSLSATSHPANPHQYNYRAATFTHGSGAAVDATVSCWTPLANTNVLNEEALLNFWEGGLLPSLIDISRTDHINTDSVPPSVGLSGNDSALRALIRIHSAVPLALNLKGADATFVGHAMMTCVLQQTYESFANHTLWNKLVGELAPLFMFSIVPRVEDALIVPFVPGLRQPYMQISGSDYSSGDFGAEAVRTLQAVGIFAGIRNDTGASLHFEDYNPGIGGWYQPRNRTTGMILLKNGPPWLSSSANAYSYSNKSTGAGLVPVGTSLSPGRGPVPDRDSPGSLMRKNKSLIDSYAHYLYAYEALKGRQGSLAGKLRFDIAPGSTVQIEGPSETFIAGDSLGVARFGEVIRVTSAINAETGQAGTSFLLAHLRNARENREEGTSVAAPPIWKNAFSGTSLLSF